MSDNIGLLVERGVMTLRIDRPAKRNALTSAMYEALAQGLDRASSDPSIRVVILTGGPDTFTSGNDLEDFLNGASTTPDAPVSRFLDTICSFEKPLIASVAGAAIGIGTSMLFHCDLVYAADTAIFQLPFVSLALTPEAGSSLLLPRIVGHAKAAELLYFGTKFDAVEAERLGIVNKVVPVDRLEAYVAERATALVDQPAAALRLMKRLLRQGSKDTPLARIAEENAIFAGRLGSPEVKEAIAAFLEKRKPDFSSFG